MKDKSVGEFEELILLVVAGMPSEAYGVSILKNLEEESGKKINISAVHVALKRLEDKGFLQSEYGGIKSERGGRRKKLYSISAAGLKILKKQFELRSSLYQRIPGINFNQ